MRIGTCEPAVPQPAGDLEAGQVRQPDVEHDRVDARAAGQLERGGAGRGALDEMPLAAEQPRDEVGEARVVLDEQEVHPPCLPPEHQRFLKAA